MVVLVVVESKVSDRKKKKGKKMRKGKKERKKEKGKKMFKGKKEKKEEEEKE